jgi:hypothetical protein
MTDEMMTDAEWEASATISQTALFEPEQYDQWRDLWVDMPAFNSDDERPFDIGYLRMSERDATPTTVPPGRYPIYVISKGRSETRLTSNALERLGLHYRLVIEPQEEAAYAAHPYKYGQLLVTPFSNLGQGSIPVRNLVWEHAIASGARRHWILDDNMDGFYRLNNNLKYRVIHENPFASIEDWVDRYENVPMAGMQYQFFAPRREKHKPIHLNTRIYSCILLTNQLGDQYRWRGRYNEDTDLSIRFLKDGYVTALFYHYLCQKMPTMTMSGGNTEELYAQTEEMDGRRLMAESLVEQHPDVARISEKWGRVQHHVDYSPFSGNRLIPIKEQS